MENTSSITASFTNDSLIPSQPDQHIGRNISYLSHKQSPMGSSRSQRGICHLADSPDGAPSQPQKRMPLSSIWHSSFGIFPQYQRTQHHHRSRHRMIRNRRGRVGRVSNTRKDNQDLSSLSSSGIHFGYPGYQGWSPGMPNPINELPKPEALHLNYGHDLTGSSQLTYPEAAHSTGLSFQLADATVASGNLPDQPSPQNTGLNMNMLEFCIKQDVRARLYPCKQLSDRKSQSLTVPSSV